MSVTKVGCHAMHIVHTAVHDAGWRTITNNKVYVSPEGSGRNSCTGMTGAMDVWGLGCCLFEMLAQRPLFADPADFSLSYDQLILKAEQNQRGQVSLLLQRPF